MLGTVKPVHRDLEGSEKEKNPTRDAIYMVSVSCTILTRDLLCHSYPL